MNKKVIIWALVILAAAVAVYFIFLKKEKPTKIVDTEVVSIGNIQITVTATGTVEPISQVQVGTQVSGTISKLYVDYNTKVKKGELLAELDKSVLSSDFKSRQSDYNSSKTEFEYQKRMYLRNKDLHDKNLISDSDFETYEYQFEKAKNSLERSSSDLNKARTNLNYAMIYSPIDGVVISRAVDEGQTVAASFNTPTLFTIANDLTKMQVVANVDEADIGQVREGLRVAFTVDAYPEDTFIGNVSQVRLQATTTSNVVTYEVIVNAPNPDLKLKPGLTANITIFTFEKNNVLTVHNKAFRFQMDSTLLPPNTMVLRLPANSKGKSVWVLDRNPEKRESKATQVAVEIGATNGSITEIKSGLKQGDHVIISSMEVVDMPKSGPSGESSPFMPKRPGQNKKTK
ncbi:MAG TPA: efflux RND transporter periplasmic adaptor subunit [Paludibacteraceae bacterium]|nr:efflux RND transporter periplasmic adaptor subunit [Paludibacteraceae bacterium]HQJ89700.1 efflux RND transporter periplasmic adaptor subunit [Paludibacteraceae bacterium]